MHALCGVIFRGSSGHAGIVFTVFRVLACKAVHPAGLAGRLFVGRSLFVLLSVPTFCGLGSRGQGVVFVGGFSASRGFLPVYVYMELARMTAVGGHAYVAGLLGCKRSSRGAIRFVGFSV